MDCILYYSLRQVGEQLIASAGIMALRYALNTDITNDQVQYGFMRAMDCLLVALSYFADGIASLFYLLALNHQRKYRSSSYFQLQETSNSNEGNEIPRTSFIKKSFNSSIALYFSLCILFELSLFFHGYFYC